jgi:hypothetical protein
MDSIPSRKVDQEMGRCTGTVDCSMLHQMETFECAMDVYGPPGNLGGVMGNVATPQQSSAPPFTSVATTTYERPGCSYHRRFLFLLRRSVPPSGPSAVSIHCSTFATALLGHTKRTMAGIDSSGTYAPYPDS